MTVPIEIERHIFAALAADVARQLEERQISRPE